MDGAGGADRQFAFEKLPIDPESLLRALDAVKAVGDPLGTFNGACFLIEMESGGHFAAPVVDIAKEEDGIGRT